MKNEHRITWVSGPATGFYIDFDNQKIGYSGTEKSLNRLQTRLLHFMLSSPGGFVTASDTEKDNELFSIDFLKYISAIKSAIKTLWKAAGKEDEAGELTDQIFEKRSTYGSTGYRLRTELTDELEDITSETSEPAPTADLNPVPASEQPSEQEPASVTKTGMLKKYFENNWLQLFLYVFLILGLVLLFDSFHITVESLLVKIVSIPFGFTFLIIALLSALPVLGGLFIDVPVALKAFEKKKGISKKDLDAGTVHEIAMKTIPRFDNSREHVLFFLICNLTGAFTVASVLLYVKSIPGLTDYLSGMGRDYAYVFTILAGCIVALLSNYGLQTSNSPTRCADNYILSRAHAFMNLIYLSAALPFAGSLIYTFLSYRFNSGSTAVITPAYIVMVLSAYCYLWFSSDSPAARKIDSISKNNFISGLPVVFIFTTIYTVLCFVPDTVCIVSLLTAPAFLLLWLVCFLKRRKENTLKLYYFVSSFFSVMAISVIVMLILTFWC